MTQLYKVPDAFAAQTRCTAAQYAADYAESVRDPNGYWERIGRGRPTPRRRRAAASAVALSAMALHLLAEQTLAIS